MKPLQSGIQIQIRRNTRMMYFAFCSIFEFDIVEFMKHQHLETGSIAHDLLQGLISFKV